MKKLIPITAALLLLCFASQMLGQTIYVAQNATGSGTSWANATGNLKAALDNATPGIQIWVKEGTYHPTTCTNCNFNDRNQYFELKNGVQLFGGFAGFETAVNQRIIAQHPTYLSGDINQDGTLDGNSFTVVFTHNVSDLTVADGLTITGGHADQDGAGPGTPQTSGGGWFNLGSSAGNASNPTLRNCNFTGNYAWNYGAGMFNDGSFGGACSPALTNCIFNANTARDGGGGMYNTGSFNGNASPVLTNCQFIGNKSLLSDGGGMFNMGQMGNSNPTLTNCRFERDTAYNEGGAMVNFGKDGNASPILTACVFAENMAGLGGAVYNDGSTNGYSAPQFSQCQFLQNHSSNDGAAMYNSGYQGTCSPSILSCLFDGNHAAFAGGAIFNNGNEGISSPIIRNSKFIDNQSETYGGAIYNFGKGNLASQVEGNSSPELTNCLFYDNQALSAGAVYNLGSELGNANAFITNCTFYGNHADIGGALYCNAGENGTGVSSPTIKNSIFWANTAGEGAVFRIIWGTPTISNSLVDATDCDALYNGNGGIMNCAGGMAFNQNPAFVSPPSGNFHLGPGSPAIDEGDNPAIAQTGVGIDLDSLPRIHNATVDMGVYEFGSMLGSSPLITQNPQPQAVCEGDVVVFSVSASGAQPLSFQWWKDGVAIAGASQNVYSIAAADQSHAGNYSCSVSNGAGSAVSQIAHLAVSAPAAVGLEIAASQTEVCEGASITLSAQPENGGFAPVFQWFLNGNAFGSSVQAFTISQLQDGDTFTCEVTSSATCVQNPTAQSNPVTIQVETLLVAALTIATATDTICQGQPVTFFALPINGGDSPSYSWTVNGLVVGSNVPSLFITHPQDGDMVLCAITSSENCVLDNQVVSNGIIIDVVESLAATIVIEASLDSTICLGQTVVFTATVSNEGSGPTFDWLINGQSVGEPTSIFSTNVLQDQDVVTCKLTSSANCVEMNPVLSNAIAVSVDVCGGGNESFKEDKFSFSLFPNPTTGKILLDVSNTTPNFVIHLLNTQGQLALEALENHTNFPSRLELNLNGLPQGIYYLQIISGTQTSVRKLVLH